MYSNQDRKQQLKIFFKTKIIKKYNQLHIVYNNKSMWNILQFNELTFDISELHSTNCPLLSTRKLMTINPEIYVALRTKHTHDNHVNLCFRTTSRNFIRWKPTTNNPSELLLLKADKYVLMVRKHLGSSYLINHGSKSAHNVTIFIYSF